MAAGLVLNSPQSPAICHSARKLPGVLMGPVCPSILSASAVTDFAVAKGTAPPGERALGPTRRVSVVIGRQGAVPLDVSTLGMTRCSWKSSTRLAAWGCVCVPKLLCEKETRGSVRECPEHFFCYYWRNKDTVSFACWSPFKAQGYSFSSSSSLLVNGGRLK